MNSRQRFAFFRVLAHGIGANPDVARLIRENQMKTVLRFRIPTMHQVAHLIECKHGRRPFAAHGSRRVQRCVVLSDFGTPEDRIELEIARPLEHPDQIVLIDGQAGDALKSP